MPTFSQDQKHMHGSLRQEKMVKKREIRETLEVKRSDLELSVLPMGTTQGPRGGAAEQGKQPGATCIAHIAA